MKAEMDIKVKQLLVQIIFVALVFPFFTKNYLDIVAAPITILLIASLVAFLSALLRIVKTKEDFIKQINYSFIVIAILYFVGYVLN